MAILIPIGKTLLSMLLAMLTGPMIKKLVVMGLEVLVSKYERRAEKTEEKEDDDTAKTFRKLLEEAKKAWEAAE